MTALEHRVAFFRSRAQESSGIHVSHLDTWTKPPQQSTLLLDTAGGAGELAECEHCELFLIVALFSFRVPNKDFSLSSLLRLSVNTEA